MTLTGHRMNADDGNCYAVRAGSEHVQDARAVSAKRNSKRGVHDSTRMMNVVNEGHGDFRNLHVTTRLQMIHASDRRVRATSDHVTVVKKNVVGARRVRLPA